MARKRAYISWNDELLSTERELREQGFLFVAGVDEAGRGPLAGNVVAAAVILPELPKFPGVFDSKQLSATDREELRQELEALPGIAIGIGESTPETIDEINILRATHRAMILAVEALKKVDMVVVDGLPVRGFPCPSHNLIKGDARCATIAAASIIAKTQRDREMIEADKIYPQYGFAEHKGYGTSAHLEALAKYGATPIHRKSFRPVRDILDPPPEQTEFSF